MGGDVCPQESSRGPRRRGRRRRRLESRRPRAGWCGWRLGDPAAWRGVCVRSFAGAGGGAARVWRGRRGFASVAEEERSGGDGRRCGRLTGRVEKGQGRLPADGGCGGGALIAPAWGLLGGGALVASAAVCRVSGSLFGGNCGWSCCRGLSCLPPCAGTWPELWQVALCGACAAFRPTSRRRTRDWGRKSLLHSSGVGGGERSAELRSDPRLDGAVGGVERRGLRAFGFVSDLFRHPYRCKRWSRSESNGRGAIARAATGADPLRGRALLRGSSFLLPAAWRGHVSWRCWAVVLKTTKRWDGRRFPAHALFSDGFRATLWFFRGLAMATVEEKRSSETCFAR